MANHYLMKYKGTYRILPELDQNTHDVPRDKRGEIMEGYDDIYIACQNGNKIYTYGHMNGNSKVVWLVAYIPSIGRGRNIKKVLDEQHIEYVEYRESDMEVEFRFKAKDIDTIATLLKAKTSGANISPFSVKNLPKAKDVKIPSNEIERYKAIAARVNKSDLLIIHKITTAFLTSVIEKKCKKKDKPFDVKSDMKKCLMSRQIKEYIWTKGFWDEFLSYFEKEIKKYHSN